MVQGIPFPGIWETIKHHRWSNVSDRSESIRKAGNVGSQSSLQPKEMGLCDPFSPRFCLRTLPLYEFPHEKVIENLIFPAWDDHPSLFSLAAGLLWFRDETSFVLPYLIRPPVLLFAAPRTFSFWPYAGITPTQDLPLEPAPEPLFPPTDFMCSDFSLLSANTSADTGGIMSILCTWSKK